MIGWHCWISLDRSPFPRKDGKGIAIILRPFHVPDTLLGVFLTLSFNCQQPWWGEYIKGRSVEMLSSCLLQVIRMSLCACPLEQESPSAISSLLCWLKASPSWSLLSLLWFRWGSGEWRWQARKFRGLFSFLVAGSFTSFTGLLPLAFLWFVFVPLYWVSELPKCGVLH